MKFSANALNKPAATREAQQPIALENSFDRHNLNVLLKRFMQINLGRLQRMREALSERQQRIIDVLPLLFHCNHPMLPGYVSRQTPARLSNYKPDKNDLRLGKTIARSFTLTYEPEKEDDIHGIYIMGSVGTIAQSEKSDLDIWLCHRPGLSKTALKELEEKCTKICDWADGMRLEMHIFLMECDSFKQGNISALNEESSGSAQRLLLLDEFYRTAIYLGGRMPLWWFVPPEAEHNYTEHAEELLHKRFLRSDLVLDFGGVASIPDGEFVGAGIWQLYKAIESPYKSVLKLLLLEAYVQDHPKIEPLSMSYKKKVYKGDINIDELDSYLMIYRRIEKYLKRDKQAKRLELARRCFYFKANKPLSKPPRNVRKSWQRQLLERLVAEWSWGASQISMMDKRNHWKASDVTSERSMLVGELNHCYRILLEFAAATGAARAISAEEITILGRKLQAAFERKPGKIEWVNPGISKDLSEDVVGLSEVYDENSDSKVWTAFSQDAEDIHPGGTAIKSSASLSELVLWCYFNGVITYDTRIEVQQAPSLSEFELRKLISTYQNWMPLPLAPRSHKDFKKVTTPTHVLILLNVGKSPAPHLDEQGIQRLSNNMDALRYSGFEENLVVSVDIVTRNSWDEIYTRRFDRDTALLDALKDYLQLCLPGTHHRPPKLSVVCIGSTHANIISHRVGNWFKEISQCYYSGAYPPSTRYLFEMGGRFYSLQFQSHKLLIESHTSETRLLENLGKDQQRYSPVVVDSNALKRHPIKAIAKTSRPEAINVYFRRFDIGTELYVVDEKGSINHTVWRGQRNYSPLKPLHRFLRSVITRQTQMNENLMADFGIYPIHFYELEKSLDQSFNAVAKKVSSEIHQVAMFEVKAIAFKDNDDRVHFDFHCDDQEFSALSFGDQLYLVVAQFILSRRRDKKHYPIYITDLDLSLVADEYSEQNELQITHYLSTKHLLEARLNQAIGILLRA
ncbi:class I adenylate cyclase [Teredinibacter sp. KSP-S5-2]|uniref:class I adenylate cyclase n=1 Tax=Teredinibacter sp. KSP-S5-2 TaxID=3034506 RepID=UPI002934F35F|nr:class I adenylate cyclase [Teredinibacter sp. KSP-S5-2]WNO08999.1 class I adenylate cyclase [Teredinibacter sp. KSP-S5-2]